MAPHDGTMTGIQARAGELSIIVAAAVDGVGTTVSVAALHAVRPADLLAVELGGAAAVLLGTAAATGRLHRRGAGRHLLLGALVPGLAFLLGDLGLARTSASNGSLLLAAEPLLSVLLAVAVLRERLPGRGVVALVVGLAGGALVALEPGVDRPGGNMTAGNLLVLGAVVAAAVFLVATRRYGDVGDGVNASAWQTTGGALSMAPFAAVAWIEGGSRLGTAGITAWAACAAVALCGVVSGVAFNRGIGRVPAARAGQLLNLTPVVGTVTSVAFLGERPTTLQLVGGTAVLAGLALLLLRGSAHARQHPLDDLTGRTTGEPPAMVEVHAGARGHHEKES
ncbi:DMT family transporter [Parafrankia discariae]|uniref:DMT family transporter n=1 Tax=Parafrankia discariae TaxID=365528 RepID=UPI00036D2333|nr:DMT family transporter [Parafrankia discariae]